MYQETYGLIGLHIIIKLTTILKSLFITLFISFIRFFQKDFPIMDVRSVSVLYGN